MRFSLLLVLSAIALGSSTVACGGSGDDGTTGDDANVTISAISADERAAIMDGLRATVKPEAGNQDILFNVSGPNGSLRMDGGWAFLMGHVQLRNGQDPTTNGTSFQEAANEGIFDGWRVEALLQKRGNGWVVVDHGVGTTDVWYDGIENRFPAPRSIYPWLDGGRVVQISPSERMSVMNGLRAVVKPELNNQDILFNVSQGSFRVSGDYCWLQGTIELRGGAEPTTAGTVYAEAAHEGIFDGWHVEALLKKDGSNWRVLEKGVGSTDVWWDGIQDRFPAPHSIFPFLDGR